MVVRLVCKTEVVCLGDELLACIRMISPRWNMYCENDNKTVGILVA